MFFLLGRPSSVDRLDEGGVTGIVAIEGSLISRSAKDISLVSSQSSISV